MSKPSSLLNISVEALYGYNNKLLASNLTECINGFKEDGNGVALIEELSRIAVVFFNINAVTEIVDSRIPAQVVHGQIEIPSLVTYKAKKYSDSEHTQQKAVAEILKIANGWFDRKTLKCGGVFAELPVYVLISRDMSGYTTDEIAVAWLHEIGHYLGYVDIVTSQFTMFGVMDSLVRGVRGAGSNIAAVDFVQSVSGKFGIQISDAEELKAMSDDDAMRLKLYDDIRGSANSAFANVTNPKQLEYIADELPAAVLGPRVAAVALSKILSKTSHPAYQSSAVFYGRTVLSLCVIIFGAATAIAPIAGVGAVLFAINAIRGTQPDTHPSPVQRLQRFRSLLLSDAKSPELTRQQALDIAADVDLIDGELSKLSTCNKSLLDFMMDMFSDTRKSNRKVEAYESITTDLQNNPLYLRAAQLRATKDY